MMKFLVTLHAFAAVIWVGGMLFALRFLRPAAVATLTPPQRLPLWAATLSNFFVWVWGCIAVLIVTGLTMIFAVYGGFGSTPVFVHIMFLLGLVMIALFGHVYFAPFKRLKSAVSIEDWQEAGAQLDKVRKFVTINLTIGLVTIGLATAGRYFLV